MDSEKADELGLGEPFVPTFCCRSCICDDSFEGNKYTSYTWNKDVSGEKEPSKDLSK